METEKIYCAERPDNTALTIAAMNAGRNQNGCAEMAALLNGNNNQWNNPFIYLVWMMMLGRNGLWGNGYGNGTQGIEIQGKLNELSAQMANNQNTSLMMDAINGNHEALHALSTNLGVSTAHLQGAIAGVQNAITQVGGTVGLTGQQVINAVLLGNKDLTAALQNCCCENKQLVQQMGYEGQIRDLQNTAALNSRIDQLSRGVTEGFASIGYQASQNTAAIVSAQKESTQRILDQMCANSQQELRDKLAQMSQDAQTAKIEAYINARLAAFGKDCVA